MKMKKMALAAAFAFTTLPALPLFAQDAVPAQPAAIDPARLAAARITVDHIFPTGTYARMMNTTMDKVMDSVMGGMGQMPLREFAAMGGLKPEELAKLGPATLQDIMAIYDPAYHERMTVTMHVMMKEMTGIMTQFEPAIRDGLAHAYAGKFTVEQLNDLNRFFATPSGALYASNAMVMYTDPEVMSKMQAFMPEMVKQMPAIMAKVGEATASLPKPRKFDDLKPAERARLASLLGVKEADLGKGSK